MAIDTANTTARGAKTFVQIRDREALRAALEDPNPLLAHINADTTWVLLLPYPPTVEAPTGRKRFNILFDPWLRGPQSDVASWFSTQWHVEAPCVETIQELNELLAAAEGDDDSQSTDAKQQQRWHIDAVAISHEFTDHCHQATLQELPPATPVIATEKAAALIKSWGHFAKVITTPGFSAATKDWRKALSFAPLPSWVGIGRVITPGNALYYHSAVLVVFDPASPEAGSDASRAVVYSPHGVQGSDLEALKSSGITTLALLHGLHDVGLRLTKQLNLGALNGIQAVRAVDAKYWIPTHDEVKKGQGLIGPILRRKKYTLADAVAHETKMMKDGPGRYEFVELSSGHGLVLV